MVIGCFPPAVRERFGIPWSRADQRQLERANFVITNTFEALPSKVHRFALRTGLRVVGSWTRGERFVPDGRVES